MANKKNFYFKSVNFAGHNRNLRKMLFLPNETLYSVLIDGRRKRPSDQKQKFWSFLPNLTHLELQTAEFGQNLAKRANFFVFDLMVFSFYYLLGHHIRFHLARITFSSDSYCELQHISKV